MGIKCGTERIWGKMRNGTDMGIKCVISNFTKNFNHKWSFFTLFFYVSVLSINVFFCNEMLIIHNITYTAISILLSWHGGFYMNTFNALYCMYIYKTVSGEVSHSNKSCYASF